MPRAVGAGLQCPPAEPARTAPLPGARSLPRAQQGPGESFPAQKARGGGAPRGASTLTSRRGLSAPPGRAVLRGRRDAFRCSTAAIFGPLAALPGGDGARFQAPDPERRPCRSFVSAACSPLLRRAGGQPVLMPAGGWAGPPGSVRARHARGRRAHRSRSPRFGPGRVRTPHLRRLPSELLHLRIASRSAPHEQATWTIRLSVPRSRSIFLRRPAPMRSNFSNCHDRAAADHGATFAEARRCHP